MINDEEAAFSYEQVGTLEKVWLAFQTYYDEQLAKTNDSFLKRYVRSSCEMVFTRTGVTVKARKRPSLFGLCSV